MEAPYQSPVSPIHRSREKAKLYHLGKGLATFGSYAHRFRTMGLGTAALLGIVAAGMAIASGIGLFAMPVIVPMAVGVVGMGVGAGVFIGVQAGHLGEALKGWTYNHRTALHEKPAEAWRKTGVALATAITCLPGGFAGYHVYKDSPAAEAAARDSLKNAFDHGVHEKSAPAQTHSVTLPAPPQRTLVLR